MPDKDTAPVADRMNAVDAASRTVPERAGRARDWRAGKRLGGGVTRHARLA